MPIAAQCGGCAARYKIVESAAGRRVRCRRCGKPFVVPGSAAAPANAATDLRALADLERKGQVLAANPELELAQYNAAISTREATRSAAEVEKKSRAGGRSVLDLATPDYRKKMGAEALSQTQKPGRGAFETPANAVSTLLCLACLALLGVSFLGDSAKLLAIIGMAVIAVGAAVWVTVVGITEGNLSGQQTRQPAKAIGVALFTGALLFGIPAAMNRIGGSNTGPGHSGVALGGGGQSPAGAQPVLSSKRSQKLNDRGEVDDPNEKPPPGWPAGKPWISHRVMAGVKPSLANMVEYSSQIDPKLQPPPDFKKNLDIEIADTIRKNGCIIRKGGQHVLLTVVDFGTKTVFFDEANGTYTPNPKGKVNAKTLRLTCRLEMGSGGLRANGIEKDVPDITGPITPELGQDLQAAIYAKQWKDALAIFQGYTYPSFNQSELVPGQTLLYTTDDSSAPPSHLTNPPGAAASMPAAGDAAPAK
jgi:predicted Zn finger-like uncharacterized protein